MLPGDVSQSPVNGVEDYPHVGLDETASEIDKVVMEEDDIHEIGEEEKEKLNDVDYLTGNPLPSDILLYAVPVCGPYSAVQSYKYRVKIIPGSAKKGKGKQLHLPYACFCARTCFLMLVLWVCIFIYALYPCSCIDR